MISFLLLRKCSSASQRVVYFLSYLSRKRLLHFRQACYWSIVSWNGSFLSKGVFQCKSRFSLLFFIVPIWFFAWVLKILAHRQTILDLFSCHIQTYDSKTTCTHIGETRSIIIHWTLRSNLIHIHTTISTHIHTHKTRYTYAYTS